MSNSALLGRPAAETPKEPGRLSWSGSAAPASLAAPPVRRKLSYIEQREYDAIEARIDKADARLRAAEQRIQAPEVVTDPQLLLAALAELEEAKADHHAVYERWVELTEKISD